jgi:hypothetical protein
MSYLEQAGYVDLPDDAELPDMHPVVAASSQVVEAMAHLDRHPDAFVRWPFAALDELAGPMGPGEVWYLCSFSGGGKTTFVCSAIDRWQRDGRRVYVMPLELQGWRFRTYLACMSLDMHPGEALSGNLRTLPGGEAKREAIKAALIAQVKAPYSDRVKIGEQRVIALPGLEKGLRQAKAFGADVVVIDHIDHVDAAGSDTFAGTKAVNHALLRMAQDNELLIVASSQLNNQVIVGQDHLARYQPPREHHVFMGGVKRQVATGMLGLYRPLRERSAEETDAGFTDLVKRARIGTVEANRVLEPHAMGVNAMKLRNFGAREGQRTTLAFVNGRVTELSERDRWTTAGGTPREVDTR